MTAAVLGGALSQWPLGFLSDRIGRRKVMAGAAAVGTLLGVISLALIDRANFMGLIVFSAAWGFVAFPIYAIAVAHANDNAGAQDYVMVSSGLLLIFGSGAIIGPFLASALMTVMDESALYIYTGAVHLCLVLYAVSRIFRRRSSPVDHQMAFQDALATAHTKSQVYEEEILHIAEDEIEPG
jgi:MFS family permease